jgi:hypothetical protein
MHTSHQFPMNLRSLSTISRLIQSACHILPADMSTCPSRVGRPFSWTWRPQSAKKPNSEIHNRHPSNPNLCFDLDLVKATRAISTPQSKIYGFGPYLLRTPKVNVVERTCLTPARIRESRLEQRQQQHQQHPDSTPSWTFPSPILYIRENYISTP